MCEIVLYLSNLIVYIIIGIIPESYITIMNLFILIMSPGCNRRGQKKNTHFTDEKKEHKIDYQLPKMTQLICGYTGNY